MSPYIYTKRLQPEFPSFSTVVTENMSYYPLRLPAYRVSHVLRYHPYPRTYPPYRETIERGPFMPCDTVDYIELGDGPAQQNSATALPSPLVDDKDADVELDTCLALQQALATSAATEATVLELVNEDTNKVRVSIKRVKAFSISVIDLALAVINAVKSRRSVDAKK